MRTISSTQGSSLLESLPYFVMPRSDQQRLSVAFSSSEKQQLAPSEFGSRPTRGEIFRQQKTETWRGGDLGIAGRAQDYYQEPQRRPEQFQQGHLGDFAREPGPVFALASVKHLLGQGRMGAARELLQQALSRYPADERLRNLERAVAPGAVIRRDVRYSDRTAELAWIKANRAHYRGKWVALLGAKALAIGDSLKAVLHVLQEQQYEETPLLHHID